MEKKEENKESKGTSMSLHGYHGDILKQGHTQCLSE
jgi:hypothetical protein